jgi:hypothetical protein
MYYTLRREKRRPKIYGALFETRMCWNGLCRIDKEVFYATLLRWSFAGTARASYSLSMYKSRLPLVSKAFGMSQRTWQRCRHSPQSISPPASSSLVLRGNYLSFEKLPLLMIVLAYHHQGLYHGPIVVRLNLTVLVRNLVLQALWFRICY